MTYIWPDFDIKVKQYYGLPQRLSRKIIFFDHKLSLESL